MGWAVGKSPDEARIFGARADRSSDGTLLSNIAAPISEGLVERARRGDKNAFSHLYKQHYAAIFRLARFHLPRAADDVVAETFLRAWKGLPRYRDTGAPFVSWLYGIARHVIADEVRRSRRFEPRETIEETAERDDGADDRLVLAAAIQRLPGDQRKVIEMKYLLGLRNPEVARLLGKSIGAVNAIQWRGLQNLRTYLARDE